LEGLTDLTRLDGTYVLTINAAEVLDSQGRAGVGSISSTWTMDGAPFILSIEPVAPIRETALTTLDVTFSEKLDLSTFTRADLTLKRNYTAITLPSTVLVTYLSGTTYRISGLSGLTTTDGNYVLTVNAAGVKDLKGAAGTGVGSVSWSMNRVPPEVV